jgi:glyoxylase-like metal-dependent hydrolase (beta-lactamase superfamily II)
MPKKNVTLLTVGAIATNCWIYQLDEENAAIIDPGDEADAIAAVLEKLNLAPKFILLTHGHFDHIAALPHLAAAYKKRSPGTGTPQIAIHRLDSEYLGPGAYASHSVSMREAMGSTSFLDALWNDVPPADILLEEGDCIGPFTVLHLPGHTRGSAAFWNKEAGVLFTGDTLFAGNWGRTDLPGGSDEQIFASLRRLLALDGNIKVYPGHGGVTTIGREAGLLG